MRKASHDILFVTLLDATLNDVFLHVLFTINTFMHTCFIQYSLFLNGFVCVDPYVYVYIYIYIYIYIYNKVNDDNDLFTT